jgi:hypothetical protein
MIYDPAFMYDQNKMRTQKEHHDAVEKQFRATGFVCVSQGQQRVKRSKLQIVKSKVLV